MDMNGGIAATGGLNQAGTRFQAAQAIYETSQPVRQEGASSASKTERSTNSAYTVNISEQGQQRAEAEFRRNQQQETVAFERQEQRKEAEFYREQEQAAAVFRRDEQRKEAAFRRQQQQETMQFQQDQQQATAEFKRKQRLGVTF